MAQLIKADVGLEVAFVDIEGWHTHAGQGNERGQLANRLADFRQFFTELARHHLGVPNQANVFPGFAPSSETLAGRADVGARQLSKGRISASGAGATLKALRIPATIP